MFGGRYLYDRPHIQPGVNKFLLSAENFYPKGLELKIKNGQLSSNTIEPFFFDPDQRITANVRRHFLIIDTKGTIDNYPNYNTYILATKNAVVYPSKSNNDKIQETSVFYFKDMKRDFTMNKNVYDSFLKMVKPYSGRVLFFVDYVVLILLFLFLIFGSLFWTFGIMFGLLILTFFAWLINLIFKKHLSYGSLYKMGMHAVTLPLIISEAAKYLKQPIPNPYTYIYFLWMLIVMFSLKDKRVEK